MSELIPELVPAEHVKTVVRLVRETPGICQSDLYRAFRDAHPHDDEKYMGRVWHEAQAAARAAVAANLVRVEKQAGKNKHFLGIAAPGEGDGGRDW